MCIGAMAASPLDSARGVQLRTAALSGEALCEVLVEGVGCGYIRVSHLEFDCHADGSRTAAKFTEGRVGKSALATSKCAV